MASMAMQQPAQKRSEISAPDFVVVDVETACSRVSRVVSVNVV